MPSDKRERESREIWAKRVERWRDTGLTSGEFCAELDINPRTLMYWAWRLRKDGKQRGPVVKPEKPKAPTASAIQPNRKRTKKPSPPPSFMELVPTPPSEGQPVEIIGGPLRGMQGKILRRGKEWTFFDEVDFLQRGASVEIDFEVCKPIGDAPGRT